MRSPTALEAVSMKRGGPSHARLDGLPPICNPPPQAEAARETTVNFRILGRISHAETIAQGAGIRELPRLRRIYGPGNWRKRKGTARIELANGDVRLAELHWYEAHGIGRREIKRKRYLD